MLGLGLLLTIGLSLRAIRIRELSARAILSLTGPLRTPPDPWFEATVRTAFAEFDRELALILQDRPVPARADRARYPDFPPR